MDLNKNVDIIIDELGNVKIEANNFKGQGCAEATKAIEKALSGDHKGGVKREYKPEWAQNGVSNTVKQCR